MAIKNPPMINTENAQAADLFGYQLSQDGGVTEETRTLHSDAVRIPSSDLPESEGSVTNPTFNPDDELMQLASSGTMSRMFSKGFSLDFLTGGVLGNSAKILNKKEELAELGLDPNMTRSDLIEIKPSWETYMKAPNEADGSFLVDMNNITPIRERMNGVLNAKKFMQEADQGKMEKRGPVILKDNGDGTYELRSGNSTYAVAKNAGWKDMPAIVMDDAEFAAYEKTKAAKQQAAQDNAPDMADVVVEGAKNDAILDSAIQGAANSKAGKSVLDSTDDFAVVLESDRAQRSVVSRVYDDNKNIFGEVVGGGSQSDDILEAATDGKVTQGTVYENVQAGVIDKQGNLLDFRALGQKGGEIDPTDFKIPDEGSIYRSLNAISSNSNYTARIEAGGRDAVTQKATQELADMLGMRPDKLEATINGRATGGVIIGDGSNGAGLAEYMLASRQLLVNEASILDDLAMKAVDGTDADKFRFRAQLELVAQLQANIKGSQTEIARALASFKMPTRSAENQSLAVGDIKGILDDFGGGDDISDVANAYLQSGGLDQRLAATREASKFKKFTDGFYEAWINILLSSPVTHTKNILGAFLTTFAHVGETVGQVGVNRVGMAFGGTDSGIRMMDAQAQIFGMVMSIQDAFGAAGRGFRYGEKVTAGSKLEGGSQKYRANAFATDKGGFYGTAVNALGKVMTLNRFPTRALEFEDNLFKVMGIRQSLYEQAMRSGNGKGLKGDALAEHIADFVHNPPASALKQAEGHAKYVTLQTDLDKMGKQLSGLRNNAIMRFFVPFFKTPYNATKYALVERTPLGMMSKEIQDTISLGKSPNATIEQRVAGQKAQTRMVMGSATMLTVAGLAANGMVTGNGPADRNEREALKRTGWQPYSVKVGDTYYSYMGAEPFSSVMSLAADGAEIMFNDSLGDEESDRVAMALTVMMANQVTDKTFMQGFSNFVDTLSDPQRYAGQTADNFIRSIIPRSVALAEKMVDPSQRMTRDILSELQSQIPWLSDELEPRRNVYGQTVLVGDTAGPDIISPIYASKLGKNYSNDEGTEIMPDRGARAYALDKEFVEIRWGPKPPPDSLTFPVIGKLEMTDKQVGVFQEVLGMMTIEAFEEVVNAREYPAMKAAALKGGIGKEILTSAFQRAYIGAKKEAQAWMVGQASREAANQYGESPYAELFANKIERIEELLNKEYEAYEKSVQ